jgi:hypothetical protein
MVDLDKDYIRFNLDEGAIALIRESTLKRLLHDLPYLFSLILGI